MAQTKVKSLLFKAQKKTKAKKSDPQREHEEWLKSISSIKLFGNVRVRTPVTTKLPSKMPVYRAEEKVNSVILATPIGGTKKVVRPELMYRDDPEMLERELKARERKFAIAPAYNKGAPQLVTDDFMKDITAGTTRRR